MTDVTDEMKRTMQDGFTTYSVVAWTTAQYPGKGTGNLNYPALGLGGETGEVLEKIKKLLRDQNGQISPEFREALRKELGDVLWYINALCCESGITLASVAEGNLDKLLDRRARGVLGGSGDNR